MIGYIIRRTLLAFLTVIVISFVSYVIMQLPPGDYVDYYIHNAQIEARLGPGGLTPEVEEEMREDFGLNDPVVVQYWNWISKVARGDFGYHFWSGDRHPIKDMIWSRVPLTFVFTLFTILITWTLALPIGIYSAVRQYSISDYTFTFVGFVGLAVPDFLLGLVVMYLLFALFDQSVGGFFSGDYSQAPWSTGRVIDLLKHMIVPGIILGTSGTAGLIRIMRNNLLDELSKPYVFTARAKGLPAWRAIIKYPVRVAINPFISGLGALFPALISGGAILSIVMSLPTLGPLLLQSIQRGPDIQLAATILFMFGVLTVVGTLISDLLLVVVDPRIRLTGRSQ